VTDDEFARATAADIDLDPVDARVAVGSCLVVRIADRVADRRERVLGVDAGEPAVCDAVHGRRFASVRESPLPVAAFQAGMPVDFDFGDSVVLVTGAGGALGSAVCAAFDAAGATVCGADVVSPDDEDFLLDPDVVDFYQGDFTDEGDVADTVEAVVDDHGGLDALVNVAGTWRGGTPVDETDADTFDFLFDVNLKTMFLASKHAIPHLRKSDGGDGDDGADQGAIVSISARSSLEGGEGDGIYRSTKAGVRILTETIAEENTGEVRANAVMPSVIDTPMNREMMDYDESWVDPADIAEVIMFLCSDAASVTSGAAVPVYGEA
jgi:NAD(P)-dependent dehydrogenase (short-subunit alcohol dehydrogenase family)